jgi:hypothetical protein
MAALNLQPVSLWLGAISADKPRGGCITRGRGVHVDRCTQVMKPGLLTYAEPYRD